MIGLVEILLFLTPFGAFAAWRLLAPHLPRIAVWGAVLFVLATGSLAAFVASRPTMHRGDRYVPPALLGDLIVPGRAVPK